MIAKKRLRYVAVFFCKSLDKYPEGVYNIGEINRDKGLQAKEGIIYEGLLL